MNPDLKISFIQSALHWENSAANLAGFSEKIISIREQVDLILLPEMFTTGFSMRPELFAETMEGDAINWMRQIAAAQHAVICGSLMMKDGNKYYNRLIWMRPDGTHASYDKRHLFGLGEEHQHYTAGDKKILVELKGWKFRPLICYDLRFPVWARNDNAYDVLLYVANWPERRINAWKTLLEARAIENQCYVVGVNRVGNESPEVYYPGESSVIDPKGEVLIRESHHEVVKTFSLSHQHLYKIRESLPFLKDADAFEIK
ncbi:MAG: amidohydrolase [Chitinophagaceae bacterium]|nr:amidohydrolase [Chitinophagaceae bacterium]